MIGNIEWKTKRYARRPKCLDRGKRATPGRLGVGVRSQGGRRTRCVEYGIGEANEREVGPELLKGGCPGLHTLDALALVEIEPANLALFEPVLDLVACLGRSTGRRDKDVGVGVEGKEGPRGGESR